MNGRRVPCLVACVIGTLGSVGRFKAPAQGGDQRYPEALKEM